MNSKDKKRMKGRTIALDFDGVLHRYEGYHGGRIDGPIRGSKRAVLQLLEAGAQVVVFTTRDRKMVEGWLAEHGFPALEVSNHKRPFWLIVDDRAMPFHGEWGDDMLYKICNFEPYWAGGRPAPAAGVK